MTENKTESKISEHDRSDLLRAYRELEACRLQTAKKELELRELISTFGNKYKIPFALFEIDTETGAIRQTIQPPRPTAQPQKR